MRRAAIVTAMTMSLMLAAACREEPAASTAETSATVASTTAAATLTPEELGELGAAIKKEPARADELLAQKNLNRQSFEAAIRDVTEDPDKSKRYAEAYRNAGG